MKTFKIGEKVYCPNAGFNIFTLSEGEIGLAIRWIAPNGAMRKREFFENGTLSSEHNCPAIFSATAENHAKIEAFYGLAFEKPKEMHQEQDDEN